MECGVAVNPERLQVSKNCAVVVSKARSAVVAPKRLWFDSDAAAARLVNHVA
jgi:hypothetical protein